MLVNLKHLITFKELLSNVSLTLITMQSCKMWRLVNIEKIFMTNSLVIL